MGRPKLLKIADIETLGIVFFREVGERLAKWRQMQSLDLAKAGQRFHVSSSTYSQMERGTRKYCHKQTVGEFAESLGSMDAALWILLGKGKAPMTDLELNKTLADRQTVARAKQWDSMIQGLLDRGYSEKFVSVTHPIAYQHFLDRKLNKGVKGNGSEGV